MITIVIYGDRKMDMIKRILISQLKGSYSVSVLTGNSLRTVGTGPPITVIHSNHFKNILLENCILIVGSSAKTYLLKQLESSTKVIVDANDSKSLGRLMKHTANIYTSGFSGKDFITFSSRGDERSVVSLQRGIKLSHNIVCEPFEIPCLITSKTDDYSILSSALTLIMLGALNENSTKLQLNNNQ